MIFLPTILIAFFCRKTPDNISKEFLVQEMQLLNELIVPGFAGDDVDINTNLTRLQNIIDDNKLSILEVINLVRIKNILSSHIYVHNVAMRFPNRFDKTC